MVAKNRGSSLLATLIFAFVLMIVISALAYNFKADSLAINTLVDEKQNQSVHEGYFGNIIGAVDLAVPTDQNIGDFRFVTAPNSITPRFEYENTNAELYNAEAYLISYDVTHQFYDNGVLKYIRNFIYNLLPSFTLTQYEKTVIPLNLPYVNIDGMTNSVFGYKIGDQNNKSTIDGGYIGYLRKPIINGYDGSGSRSDYIVEQGNGNIKYIICHNPDNGGNTIVVSENSWDAHHDHGDYRGPCLNNSSQSFTINIYGNILSISYPEALALSYYDFSVGWELRNNQWTLLLAIYDLDRVYTSSASLNDIKNNPQTAELALSDWKEVSGLEEFDGGDIVNVGWYFDNNQSSPKLLILEKFLRNGNYDIDAYKTTYNALTKTYAAEFTDRLITGTSDFSDKDVYDLVPDSLFTLQGNSPLIFQGRNIVDFNYALPYKLGDGNGSTKSLLVADVINQPLLIKKNATQLFIVYFNGNTYYKYSYTPGATAPVLLSSPNFPGETIQKIIAKFGALFVITNSNIYVRSIEDDSTISSVAIAGSNYQILRDSDGRIYAIADGLSCTIDSNCSSAARVYFDTGCAAYNGCSSLEILENVQPYLNMVYKGFEY
ncbi:hypothetical protein B4919_09075 [Francisella tularensis subsp. novicida]|uniref:hypothetical protein n=1 Tax=Francisella tularensis TaxID=263 RepID=UPI000CE29F7D|nr:hypothetical protein [Francisella tularensis]AVC44923.1 hypothetical protein B4919_09075 [Francisella tularensis subsp. novicida]